MPDPGDITHLMLPKVQHTNIVQVFGMWYDNYKIAIVMELCDESLFHFMKNWKKLFPGPKRKLTILRDIAEGMSCLHRHEITHGNLHTGNVLLRHFGNEFTTKVADFHMAEYIDSDKHSSLTTRFTEEDYLPPEMLDHTVRETSNLAMLTPKVDVFCFGELALEVAHGSYLAPSKKRKSRNEVLSELQRREKHLSNLKQSEKEWIGLIIRKCLADAPEGRPSFTDILRDVEKNQRQPDVEELQNTPVSYTPHCMPPPPHTHMHVSMHLHLVQCISYPNQSV